MEDPPSPPENRRDPIPDAEFPPTPPAARPHQYSNAPPSPLAPTEEPAKVVPLKNESVPSVLGVEDPIPA